MNKRHKYFRLLSILSLYSLIVLYTLVFPTTASWFIFYAFTLWLVVSFLSTRQSYHLTRTTKKKRDDNTYTFTFIIENKRRQPFLLSSIDITLVFNDIRRPSSTAVFFSRKIKSQFQSLSLPRGHHETLTLDIVGTGLFGVWRKHSTLVVPINIDVYPDLLKKSERQRLMHHLTPYLTETAHSLHHDYYMTDIRSFQNRDTLAGIDWKTSLKRGQWMVKEYEKEEETPVDLCFLGFDTESFETLLSVGYSLLKEMKESQDVNLFLVGEFSNTLTAVQDEAGFLTIEPTQHTQQLIQLSQRTLNTPSKKIIIKSSLIHVPDLPSETALYIDEEAVLMIKGGETDEDDLGQSPVHPL
ncbi:Protein of unknown function DUF58 [Alkalibacterium subtropicum]|uniref:Uncharacterized protein n=1 Tax=Alkalibacterium subtropicum TaxID=753702 RepID=A0A1I1G073_9LACT|nr:DUF58 domain-containing protein [Alkalibacterium subtropicum]SFC05024.1 Protein of unknown function DUF58 [Alkalibacterium subtropicum]